MTTDIPANDQIAAACIILALVVTWILALTEAHRP